MAESKPIKDSQMEGSNSSIDKPRLTPQGRTDPSGAGEDKTSPMPGRKEETGQPSKAEG